MVGRRHLDIERLCDRQQRLGKRPCRFDGAAQSGIEDRATIDRDDLVRTCRGEPDFEHILDGPRMQGNAPATNAVGVDERVDLTGKPGLRQGLDDQTSLPCAVAFGFPVLYRAAPAYAEMRAERGYAPRAWVLYREQAPAVGMAR